ncbi:MAG: type II toxin-antitoxin system HicA family toxin [bacterium]|nr:type II toxin-antitoxin system HicA family toxin [bacterium]
MSKIEKLFEKIKNNPKNVRFDEIEQFLLDIGFEERQARRGSSHYIFYHEKLEKNVVIPKPHKDKQVKPIYIKKALMAIEILERRMD